MIVYAWNQDSQTPDDTIHCESLTEAIATARRFVHEWSSFVRSEICDDDNNWLADVMR